MTDTANTLVVSVNQAPPPSSGACCKHCAAAQEPFENFKNKRTTEQPPCLHYDFFRGYFQVSHIQISLCFCILCQKVRGSSSSSVKEPQVLFTFPLSGPSVPSVGGNGETHVTQLKRGTLAFIDLEQI